MPGYETYGLDARRAILRSERESLTHIINDPGDAGTIRAETSGIVHLTSIDPAETRVIAYPAFEGQMLIIILTVAGAGDAVELSFVGGGPNAVDLDEQGDWALLVAGKTGTTQGWLPPIVTSWT